VASPLAEPRGGLRVHHRDRPPKGVSHRGGARPHRDRDRRAASQCGPTATRPAARVRRRLHAPHVGPSSQPRGWGRCWHNSWSPPARRCSTCRRPCRRGCGCSMPAAPTRPTRTTRGRRRSWRYVTAGCARTTPSNRRARRRNSGDSRAQPCGLRPSTTVGRCRGVGGLRASGDTDSEHGRTARPPIPRRTHATRAGEPIATRSPGSPTPTGGAQRLAPLPTVRSVRRARRAHPW
jgi:hypothetical protein